MKLSEMIKVMQHYENDGEVEYREKESIKNWRKIATPSWDWDTYVYRIKEPEQKVTIEKWLCEYLGCKKLKSARRWFVKLNVKSPGSTWELHPKLAS